MGTTCMLWPTNAISTHPALFFDFAVVFEEGWTKVVIQTDFKEEVTLQYILRLKISFRWIGGKPGALISGGC